MELEHPSMKQSQFCRAVPQAQAKKGSSPEGAHKGPRTSVIVEFTHYSNTMCEMVTVSNRELGKSMVAMTTISLTLSNILTTELSKIVIARNLAALSPIS
jgi:hypothetical protein